MSLYISSSLFLWACFFRLVTDLPEIAGPPEQSLTVPAYFLHRLTKRRVSDVSPRPARPDIPPRSRRSRPISGPAVAPLHEFRLGG